MHNNQSVQTHTIDYSKTTDNEIIIYYNYIYKLCNLIITFSHILEHTTKIPGKPQQRMIKWKWHRYPVKPQPSEIKYNSKHIKKAQGN